jgi:hypothetical protein
VVEDPVGCDTPSPLDGEVAIAFRYFETLGIRDGIAFAAAWPTAHTLACLRFAEHVTALVARLTTGQAGSLSVFRRKGPLVFQNDSPRVPAGDEAVCVSPREVVQ